MFKRIADYIKMFLKNEICVAIWFIISFIVKLDGEQTKYERVSAKGINDIPAQLNKTDVLNVEDCSLESENFGGLAFAYDKTTKLCQVNCEKVNATDDSRPGKSADMTIFNRVKIEENETRCPCGMLRYDQNCFIINSDLMTWNEAKSYCTGLGSHLVTVRNIETHKEIVKLVTGSHIGAWLGGNDIAAEGTWRWDFQNEALTYTDQWLQGAPGNFVGDCMEIGANGDVWKWMVISCSLKRRVLCQVIIE